MTTDRPYRDRRSAGRVLAREPALAGLSDALVLALPRGGVPVADEIAAALGLPLDVFLVRKLGLPSQPEFAMGALATGGIKLFNAELLEKAGVSPELFEEVVDRETIELDRRERLYRRGRPPQNVAGRTVILVDDGVATGFTLRAAIAALRHEDCRRLVVAVPVGAAQTCSGLTDEVDLLLCPLRPEPLHAVGLWYDNFSPISDEEVCACIARHAPRAAA